MVRVLWKPGLNHWNVKNDFTAAFGQVLLVLRLICQHQCQPSGGVYLVPVIYTSAAYTFIVEFPSLPLFIVSTYLFLPCPTLHILPLTRKPLVGQLRALANTAHLAALLPTPTPPPAGQSRYNCLWLLSSAPSLYLVSILLTPGHRGPGPARCRHSL